MNKLNNLIGSTIGIVSLMFGFLGTHFWLSSKIESQRNHYEQIIGEYRAEALKTAELKTTIEHGFQDLAQKARDDSTKAKADSDARFAVLNRSIGGLQGDFARTAKTISQANRTAVDEYVGTTGRVLSTCMERYVWMGERANKHRIDLIEHRAAWPKYVPTQ